LKQDGLKMQHARTAIKKILADIVRHEDDGGAMMAWPVVCGAKTAERTAAVSFASGVLTVAVPDEAWRRQLQSFVPQYLAALNQMVAEPVINIEFRAVPRGR
jgi:predicted nucleic acid-binding Zn ribbon protein